VADVADSRSVVGRRLGSFTQRTGPFCKLLVKVSACGLVALQDLLKLVAIDLISDLGLDMFNGQLCDRDRK
jgi:hypothetical protein